MIFNESHKKSIVSPVSKFLAFVAGSAYRKKLSYTHLFFLFIYVTDFLLDLLLPEIMGGETQGDFFITESYVAGP